MHDAAPNWASLLENETTLVQRKKEEEGIKHGLTQEEEGAGADVAHAARHAAVPRLLPSRSCQVTDGLGVVPLHAMTWEDTRDARVGALGQARLRR